MGGYGALVNGLKYSETFSRIIALSAHFPDYEDGGSEWTAGSDKDPEQYFLDARQPVPIFMTVGEQDGLRDESRRYRDFLLAHGAELQYYEEPGDHERSFWNRNIDRGMAWLESQAGQPG